jgi:hypothetical protein
MKPADHILNATGTPPHVKELGLLKDTLHTCGKTLQTLNKMISDMQKCTKESIEEAAEHFAQSDDHVTSSCPEGMFETFESETLKEIKTVTQTQHTPAANGDRPSAQTFVSKSVIWNPPAQQQSRLASSARLCVPCQHPTQGRLGPLAERCS